VNDLFLESNKTLVGLQKVLQVNLHNRVCMLSSQYLLQKYMGLERSLFGKSYKKSTIRNQSIIQKYFFSHWVPKGGGNIPPSQSIKKGGFGYV
jgi:hypothetical protein